MLVAYFLFWSTMQVGKAYFELVDYLEADRYFEFAHRLSPCTLDGMDIYSTVLYVSEIGALGLATFIGTFISKLTRLLCSI
jgi:hypothetical protein